MFCTSMAVCAARQSGCFRKEAFYQQICNLSDTTDAAESVRNSNLTTEMDLLGLLKAAPAVKG